MENKSNNISYCFVLLGENIKYHRKRKNITLEELGLAIGLDKSAIFHIEKGKPITFRTLLKIAAYLEVSILDLVNNFPNLTKDDLSI
ncbi:MAG: helix-turn-helix transcriptional regulator [Vicingaceae bacterium]|nr:helix-turn-helix transcriptional regulator [Vicingaceae bacterium]